MSEIKPCPFCGDEEPVIERYGDNRVSTVYQCHNCGCSLSTGETFNHGHQWNTRTVPCVTEFVRYDLVVEEGYLEATCIDRVTTGEYVLYSEAAKILAAKDAGLNKLEAAWLNAEAKITELEAELDQIKAQEPVAWLCEKLEGEDRFSKVVCNPLSVEHLAGLGGNATPLYASPAPAADLKTKLSRYEQALRDIAAFKEKDRTDAETTQWNRAGVYAATIARAALNP